MSKHSHTAGCRKLGARLRRLRKVHDEAQEWLHTDGFDEAVSIALADQEYEREYAAELRADR